jgi:hypothetical protein
MTSLAPAPPGPQTSSGLWVLNSSLNLLVCMVSHLLLHDERVLVLVIGLVALHLIFLHDYLSCLPVVAWFAWQVYMKYVLPFVGRDWGGVASLLVTFIGIWVGLGPERNLNQGTIRYPLYIFYFVSFLLPFFHAVEDPIEGLTTSLLFFFAFHFLQWIKLEQKDTSHVWGYLFLSTFWILVSPTVDLVYGPLKLVCYIVILRAFFQQLQNKYPSQVTATKVRRPRRVLPANKRPKKLEFIDDFTRSVLHQKGRANGMEGSKGADGGGGGKDSSLYEFAKDDCEILQDAENLLF